MSLTTPSKIRELQIKLYRKAKNEFRVLSRGIRHFSDASMSRADNRGICASPRNSAQAFETVDQFVAVLAPAHDDGRQLPIALQRPRHGAFRFRHRVSDSVRSVRRSPPISDRADYCRPSAALASPSLRDRLNVSRWPDANQYVTVN